MFGVGPQEMVLIGLVLLIVFGPGKLPSMARDLGRFVNKARGYVDDFKDEIVSDEKDRDDQRPKLKT